MFKNIKFAIVIALTLLVAGCATQTFIVNPKGNSTLRSEQMKTFFINGLGQEKITKAYALCGGSSSVYKVQTQQTFLDGFLGALTLGIYTPRTARVYCKS